MMRRNDGFIFLLVPFFLVGVIALVGAAVVLNGCATKRERTNREATLTGVSAPVQAVVPGEGGVARVAVLDFAVCCADRPLTDPARVDSDPLTGLTFTIGTTPAESGEIVADLLQAKLTEKGFTLIPEVMINDAIAELPAGISEIEAAAYIGRATGAEAVFAGRVMRYSERQGTQLAASHPASVAFSMAAIRPADGSIIWKAKFDKAQRALFEDVREIGSFVKGGMVWQTAIEYANLGVEELVKKMPLRPVRR